MSPRGGYPSSLILFLPNLFLGHMLSSTSVSFQNQSSPVNGSVSPSLADVEQDSPPEFRSSRLILDFQLLRSSTGEWCTKTVTCPRHFDSFWGKITAFYQGVILWLVDTGVLAFDPKNSSDQCPVIDLPDDEVGRIGVSWGHLHYFEVRSQEPFEPMEKPILIVWMMTNFEAGEWVLKHSIRYDHLWALKQFFSVPITEKYFQWVSFHPTAFDTVFFKCDGQLVTCRVSSACLEVLPCDITEAIFYRLEWDVTPLLFQPWPTDVTIASKESDVASTSWVHPAC